MAAPTRPATSSSSSRCLTTGCPSRTRPIPVNGVADVGTTLAIEAYQAVIMQMTPPSGRVDPGSATYYSLAARPLVANALPTSVGHFGEIPSDVASAAVASRQRWTVPASVTVAQWAVESAWGASMPPGSNNPFGIKATGDQPGVESPTREVKNGESVTVTDRFRVFNSLIARHLMNTAACWRPLPSTGTQ